MNTSCSINYNLKIPARNFILAILGCTLLSFASQLSIPLTPVPVTLQTVTALFIGMMYGYRLGGYTILLYLIAGALGMPVFANWSFGLPVLFSPTGGYILGFLPAAIICGYLLEKEWINSSKYKIFFAGLAGDIIIFACGFTVLSFFIGWKNSYILGVTPFLFIEVLKLLSLTFFVANIKNEKI